MSDQAANESDPWPRLEFQREASGVQRELAGVMRKLHQLLSDVRASREWSEEYGQKCRELLALGYEQIDAWLGLAPPVELSSHWEELLTAFEQLGGFLEEFCAIGGAPPDTLEPILIDYQRRVTAWLHEANRMEGELAEREAELSPVKPPRLATEPWALRGRTLEGEGD